MFRTIRLLATLAAVASLAACGGHDNAPSTPAATTPTRGQLLETPTLAGSYSAADLLSLLSSDPLGKLLLQLTFSPTCTVNVYHMKYETVGGAGEATTASGALMVPTGSAASCQGPRPLVMYAHGTNASKTFNMADLTGNSEALLMASVFASQGYIVVAPNYAGYDTSTLSYHPYLNGDQQSKDMIDSLAAARSAYTTASTSDSGKLFISGYSQGGYVAMATHKAMQAAGTVVTAAAPMSGPYALAAFGDAIFMGEVDMSAPANFDLLVTSYQHSYKNVYTNPTDVFEAQYAAGADELLPSTNAITAIYSNGQLPQNALFNSTAPSPAYAAMTPATTPANLAPSFALGFGTNDLVTNAYRLAYLQDAAANPDGGYPTTTTGVAAAAPGLALRQDLKSNDLRNWAPTAPVLLCAGDSDPTVFYLNTQLIDGYWASTAPTTSVTLLDVDSSAASGDPYANEKTGFAAAKAAVEVAAVIGGATDGGAMAVLQVYHSTLIPPFCLYAAKSFFDGH
ncbi:MAG TPA: prolyl oligopeptidase family serine peptidase [Steroidobacteraceae bacterium]|jgi:esterase/lipase|nr:prolyl oligopeptidase family serine peptidase [Steroidobacteraceae bacterium]